MSGRTLVMFLSALLAIPNLALARHFSITLSTPGDRFIMAQGGGGGRVFVDATARPAGEDSTFIALDLNHGELTSGDRVAFKTRNGTFLSAINGGGERLLADRTAIGDWETFYVARVTQRASDDSIKDGDIVSLKTAKGNYLSLRPGAGSEVDAKATAAGKSEWFRINMPGMNDRHRNGEPATGKLSGPFSAPQMILRPVVGVDDLGRTEGNVIWCKNAYFGENFPACYRGHEGTDFLLAGHVLAQAAGSIDVYTVAGGTVAAVFDGNTDKCFYRPNKPTAKAEEFVFCANDVRDGKQFISDAQDANFVAIVQDDGVIAYYHHLKKQSIVLREGMRVECGQLVGKIGSSGISSVPHLHLTLLRVKKDAAFPSSREDFKNIAANRSAANFINPYAPMLWQSLIGVVPKKTCTSYVAGASPTCGLGQPCPSNICQPGLLMKDGVCKRLGILPDKTCDDNQLCGPGLACTGGVCRLPSPPKCGANPPCLPGFGCDNGKCVLRKP